MSEIMIQYQGFHPSEFTKSYLNLKLSRIQAKAPQSATLRAVFSRKNKTFSASVRIMSAAGHFFATASGEHMREVSRKLNERMGKQLRRWKTIRHQHQSLRDLDLFPAGEENDNSVA